MSNESAKEKLQSVIDERADGLIALSKDVYEHPETGFREHRTASLVADYMRSLGLQPREGVAITGVVATLDTGRAGPHLAVMGELDSLIVPDHDHADSETGAAHVCGHNTQLGSMLGVAAGLSAPSVLQALSGKITFIAVPAEEYIEIEYREGLRNEGKLEFLAGKQEFIRLGVLDDVDLAMMTHAIPNVDKKLYTGTSHNGMLAKYVRFKGRAAHAGGMPHLGINALNAANLAMAGIHAQRETFQDGDHVRVHPILTRGGAAVSSVPADVSMEMFVRAATLDAVHSAAMKVDRALKAGAMAVGASVEINTAPGYAPSRFDPVFNEVYTRNAEALVGKDDVAPSPHRTSSTDMGDVSLLMPAIHPYASGSSGTSHGSDYSVDDYDTTVTNAATAMGMTAVDLLSDGAAEALRVVAAFDAPLTKDAYLAQARGFRTSETYVGG
jgi:amidohydrolase